MHDTWLWDMFIAEFELLCPSCIGPSGHMDLYAPVPTIVDGGTISMQVRLFLPWEVLKMLCSCLLLGGFSFFSRSRLFDILA